MKRRTFIRATSAGGLVGLAGCNAPSGNGGGETTTAETETTTTEGGEDGTTTEGGDGGDGGTQQVQMITEGSEYIFDPIGLFVENGTTVEWVIESGSHSSTAYVEGNSSASVTRIPDEAESWDSGILSEEGASFSYTFDVNGTYDYFCTPHKALGMIGRVVCGEPGGVEGDPPDGELPAPQEIVDQGSIPYDDFAGGGNG
ncbi:plastocyanin/azurin family copper-binding protein [Halorussus ruber]|uniref:plastocyanin/azurin family copper-binding protein n=1 Tax=Halorussus ruber TaxID=1126238 RepID=UPI001091A240|nr:plastocyanin/azurin family copper-binding protein [Halorussus ruber]